MSKHRFHVGELVRTHFSVATSRDEKLLDVIAAVRPAGIYEVVRLLPELDNGEPQYRIRRDREPERIVRESQLTPAVHAEGFRRPMGRLRPLAGAGRPSERKSPPAGS